MRGGFAALAAFGLTVAAPAMAQGIALKPGETVVLHIDSSGAVSEVSRGPAQLNDYDRAVIAESVKGSYGDAPDDAATNATINDAMPPAPAIQRGQIRFTLAPVEGDRNLLIIENGYGGALRYQARLNNGYRTGFANVCLVKPVRGSYEYWPFKVQSVTLLSLTLSDWTPGDPAPCQE